jgi:ankyrin repeat protein
VRRIRYNSLNYSVAYNSFTTSCKISIFLFHIISDFSILKHAYLLNMVHLSFCIQDGNAPVIVASQYGHTETLALLLANKADVNSADKVQWFKIFGCLQLIDKELKYKNISVS